MKVIDLLNKIANGEEVPRIIHCVNNTYIWNNDLGEYYIKNKVFEDLEFYDLHTFDLLNATVEIIEDTPKEDKKIEKLDHLIGYDIQQFKDLREYVEITTNDLFYKTNKIIDKLNEIIDKVNGDNNE